MTKRIIIIVLLLASINVSGQGKKYFFKPKWKVGITKKATIKNEIKGYENGKIMMDTTYDLDVKFKVYREDKQSYFMKIEYKNVALFSVVRKYDKLNKKFKKYQNVTAKFKVSKKDGEVKLVNWKKSREFILSSFKQIEELADESPEIQRKIKNAMAPLAIKFATKESTEGYFLEEFAYVFIPFGSKFLMNDTFVETGKEPNPFNPKDSVEQTARTILTIHNKSKKLYKIKTIYDTDMSLFKKMMAGMMRSMAKSFGANDSLSAKQSAEMNSLDFKLDFSSEIIYNYKTTWVEKSIFYKTITIVSENKKSITTSKKTVVFH